MFMLRFLRCPAPEANDYKKIGLQIAPNLIQLILSPSVLMTISVRSGGLVQKEMRSRKHDRLSRSKCYTLRNVLSKNAILFWIRINCEYYMWKRARKIAFGLGLNKLRKISCMRHAVENFRIMCARQFPSTLAAALVLTGNVLKMNCTYKQDSWTEVAIINSRINSSINFFCFVKYPC